jgi:hypothetical protein
MRLPAVATVMLIALCCTVNAQWRYRDPNAPRAADGSVDMKAPAPRTASGTVDLSGLWQTDLKYNFNLASDLKPGDVVMRPWAQALFDERRDNNGKEDPEGFCMPPGFPRVNGVPFPQKIIQLPTAIVILYETRTTFRQIFLDNHHSLTTDPQPTWMGYSKGRWDGDTLIVETTGFNDRTWLDDAGHPHSEQMKVTERFRRPSFGQLLVDITIDDAKTYAKPWSVTQAFQVIADGELIEYICNENNLAPPHLVGK